MNIVDKINHLKEKEGISILAHNYQPPEIQDIADFLGDSLDLCYRAQALEEETILFAGVNFMAESALILNPEKTILIPETTATCPMAIMLTPEILVEKKKRYSDAPVILYGNTTASAKALADVICTSANADHIVNSLDENVVLFGPDKNLMYWVKKHTKKEIIPVPDEGYCYVHNFLIRLEDILVLKEKHPSAEVLVHPECVPEVQQIADHILSTNGMIKRAKKASSSEFIIGTEKGLCYRLRKELPDKTFYQIDSAVCKDMKKTTLEKIYATMKNKKPRVELPSHILKDARKPLDRMLELGRND
ncbi:MAG: quinolinate synthase NadA [Candidatus Methanofastidiosia archaeon]